MYQHKVPPRPPTPGQPLLIHVTPFQIDYVIPTEVDMDAVVRQLKKHKAGVHTHLRYKHLKGWMQDSYLYRYTTLPKP